MPRPDKDIRPGQLDGPVSPARRDSWTKYGGAETVDGRRGDESSVEVTVDDITVTNHVDEFESKYATRGTSAHGVGLTDDDGASAPLEYVREWVVDRTVEGRMYHRSDRLVKVELGG